MDITDTNPLLETYMPQNIEDIAIGRNVEFKRKKKKTCKC